MKSYYQIKKETDLLGSFDLLEMQAYILLLKYLLRMGKKEGVTPAEDWGKVKDLMARVKNHISFHARGAKPSEITVEFYSPEVKRLFHAVYGDGNATWTKEWLETFESVKDEIDRQVENERPMCQFAAISGKRCDKCQCPDPIVSTDEQLMGGIDDAEVYKQLIDCINEEYLFFEGSAVQNVIEAVKQKFTITPKTQKAAKLAGDTEKPRFVVGLDPETDKHTAWSIEDTDEKIDVLYTASQESAEAIAELLNFTIAGGKL